MLGPKPLVVWSLEAARNVPEICDILVSTDDPTIAAVCKEAGALVPWLRPAELATDTAGSVGVALHALDWYEATNGVVDGLLLLQPTSPFRTAETVRKGIALFEGNGQVPVVGVSAAAAHPMWTFRLESGYLTPFIPGSGLETRSQDLPAAYAVNGSFYLLSPKTLRENKSFFGPQISALIVDSDIEALDIDTALDWVIAEAIIQRGLSSTGN